MKECELCGNAARMYCEADQASLCCGCDEKVHCANFLVARHSRSLLCHVCQSPTSWNASGPKLTLTVSVCDGCVESHSKSICDGEDEAVVMSDDGGHDEDDDDDERDYSFGEYEDEEEDEDEDEDEDVEGENQVVPWSCTSSEPLPPPASSSSSEEEEEEERSTAFSTLKRAREITDLDSDDEIGCSSSIMASGVLASEEASSSGSTRATKQRRIADANQPQRTREESRSTAIISSLRRLQNDKIVDGDDAAATVLGICNLSRDHSR